LRFDIDLLCETVKLEHYRSFVFRVSTVSVIFHIGETTRRKQCFLENVRMRDHLANELASAPGHVRPSAACHWPSRPFSPHAPACQALHLQCCSPELAGWSQVIYVAASCSFPPFDPLWHCPIAPWHWLHLGCILALRLGARLSSSIGRLMVWTIGREPGQCVFHDVPYM